MNALKAFLAGFVSTVTFHQGLLAVLHAAGVTPRAPYSMEPTRPFQVPAVISLAFWGGIWGIVLWLAIRRARRPRYWWLALVIGAVAPSLIAFLVVFPLKGQPVGGGWQPQLIAGALLLNGAWGIGVAWLLRLLRAVPGRN